MTQKQFSYICYRLVSRKLEVIYLIKLVKAANWKLLIVQKKGEKKNEETRTERKDSAEKGAQ